MNNQILTKSLIVSVICAMIIHAETRCERSPMIQIIYSLTPSLALCTQDNEHQNDNRVKKIIIEHISLRHLHFLIVIFYFYFVIASSTFFQRTIQSAMWC